MKIFSGSIAPERQILGKEVQKSRPDCQDEDCLSLNLDVLEVEVVKKRWRGIKG
jgi:hypothetical protein